VSATYTAEELAELLGVSAWSVYASVKSGGCPIEPIRVGRRMVWPRSAVDRLLGLEGDDGH
jgi:excisionase family DNA binding protein